MVTDLKMAYRESSSWFWSTFWNCELSRSNKLRFQSKISSILLDIHSFDSSAPGNQANPDCGARLSVVCGYWLSIDTVGGRLDSPASHVMSSHQNTENVLPIQWLHGTMPRQKSVSSRSPYSGYFILLLRECASYLSFPIPIIICLMSIDHCFRKNIKLLACHPEMLKSEHFLKFIVSCFYVFNFQFQN